MNIDVALRNPASARGHDDGLVAPFAVLRTATLPFAAMDALRLRMTESLLTQILAAEATMEALRERVADTLFNLVQVLENDTGLRRKVVNLRRDVHNGRCPKLSDDQRAAIAAYVTDPQARLLFDDWCSAGALQRDTIAALAEAVTRETQDVLRPALRAPLDLPQFHRAVALAAPRTARMIANERKLPRTPWPDKLERSLLGYLARASVKTSPFSSFMSVSTIGTDAVRDAPPPYAPAAGFVSTAEVNRGLAAQLERLSQRAAAEMGGLALTVNPTLIPTPNGRHMALCNADVVMAGRGWSEQRLAQFRLGAQLGAVLEPGTGDTWAGWVTRLVTAGVPAEDASDLLGKLLERGVMAVPPLVDAFSQDVLDTLAARFQGSGSARLASEAAQVQELGRAVAGFSASAGHDRLTRIETAEAVANGLRDRLAAAAGGQAPEPLTNTITEDCWLEGVQGGLGRNLLAPLTDLTDFLRGQVAIAPAYTRLVAAFVMAYGPGGTCDDIMAFLTGAAPRLVDIPEFGARIAEIAPEPAPEGARIPVTAHLQIASDPRTGDAEFVMNRVFDGAGWLASRFTRAHHPQATALTGALRSWLDVVAEGAEPVDMPVAGHCSDLQAHAALTRRVLHWPGEPIVAGGSIPLDPRALRLRHDPQSGFLALSDADGAAVSLQYLGNTFPNPTWGVRYALSILSRPFVVARPDMVMPDAEDDSPVRFQPALRHGRVVLRRPTWWVSSAYLRDRWLQGTPAEQLLTTAREVDRLGLPPCVYAQIYVPLQHASLVTTDKLDANRKPIWVDTRNPFWLAMLERLTRKASWVLLTAPTPSPENLWFNIAGNLHVTEIHLEMLIRAGKRRRTGNEGKDRP
jgi:hypothetical protein